MLKKTWFRILLKILQNFLNFFKQFGRFTSNLITVQTILNNFEEIPDFFENVTH